MDTAKRLLVPLVVALLTATMSTPAAADPLDPLGALVKVIPLPTLPFGPTDIDPTTLVVTDDELAGAGQLLPSLSETEPQPTSGVVALAVDRGLPLAMASGLVGLAAGLVSPLVAAVVVGIASRTVTSGATLVVDDDNVQCPGATFTTIGAAVAAANPGDTIQVCAGTYPESVTVPSTKPGLIIQAVPAQDLTTSCKGPTPPNVNPALQSIVQLNTSASIFNVQADNVVIDGFIIQANTAGPGISTAASGSGYQIRNNLIQNNQPNGLVLNSSGTSPTNVKHNCFRQSPAAPPNFTGPAQHRGIQSGAVTGGVDGLKNVTIENNHFTGEPEASISVFASGAGTQSQISITHNSIIGDQSIEFVSVSGGLIQNNLISQPGGTAIVLAGVTSIEVSLNKLLGGAGNGIAVLGNFRANTNLTVNKNKATGFAMSGIKLDGPAGGTSVTLNKSEGNTFDGIRAEATSSGYVIDKNGMKSNGDVDCLDASGPGGPGTAGTANTWTNDKGDTQNFDPNIRGSICKKASGP